MDQDNSTSNDHNERERAKTLIDYWSGECLTPRERAVLSLLAEGQCNKVIAHNINVSVTTVKSYISNIFKKLGCGNRVQAALIAFCVENDLRAELNRFPNKFALQKKFTK